MEFKPPQELKKLILHSTVQIELLWPGPADKVGLFLQNLFIYT